MDVKVLRRFIALYLTMFFLINRQLKAKPFFSHSALILKYSSLSRKSADFLLQHQGLLLLLLAIFTVFLRLWGLLRLLPVPRFIMRIQHGERDAWIVKILA